MSSWLNNIFGSKQAAGLPVKVDMHSHLLPGIDDGSQSVEESLSLVTSLLDLGYEEFICTPHIMGDVFRNSEDTISNAHDKLMTYLGQNGVEAKITYGAEHYLDDWFHQKVKAREKLLCLKDNVLLFETSYMNAPAILKEVIFDLQSSGYDLVLAHPERYIYLYDSFEKFQELYDLNIKFQINLNSLTGYYSPAAKKFAQKLIDNKMVDYVGTDCHA
jgi:tyrosine-protein phosphatase YwqE